MSYTIDQLFVGQKSEFGKTITEADVYLFAGITGDCNPAHLNAEYAKKTPFRERIAHGILSLGLVSTVLGTELPGKGTIYMGQNVKFLAPVHFGDTVTAVVEVKSLQPDKNKVILRTYCINQDGTVVLDGEATVMPPKK